MEGVRRSGEVAASIAGNVDIREGVCRDAISAFQRIATSQRDRVNESSSSRVELRDKNTATGRRAVAFDNGKVGRSCYPGHIGISRGVDSDCVRIVNGTTPQIGRVNERGPGGVELRHKGV